MALTAVEPAQAVSITPVTDTATGRSRPYLLLSGALATVLLLAVVSMFVGVSDVSLPAWLQATKARGKSCGSPAYHAPCPSSSRAPLSQSQGSSCNRWPATGLWNPPWSGPSNPPHSAF